MFSLIYWWSATNDSLLFITDDIALLIAFLEKVISFLITPLHYITLWHPDNTSEQSGKKKENLILLSQLYVAGLFSSRNLGIDLNSKWRDSLEQISPNSKDQDIRKDNWQMWIYSIKYN